MTQDEAIAKIRSLGITLDSADVNELKTAGQAELEVIVKDWLNLVAPPVRTTTLSEILKILKQVPEWVGIAVKIGQLLGVV